jgi:hypothetical protein
MTFPFLSPAALIAGLAAWCVVGTVVSVAFGLMCRGRAAVIASINAELVGVTVDNAALRVDCGRLRAWGQAWETVSWSAWSFIETHDWVED